MHGNALGIGVARSVLECFACGTLKNEAKAEPRKARPSSFCVFCEAKMGAVRPNKKSIAPLAVRGNAQKI